MPHRDGRQTVLILDSEFWSMENTPRTAVCGNGRIKTGNEKRKTEEKITKYTNQCEIFPKKRGQKQSFPKKSASCGKHANSTESHFKHHLKHLKRK